MMCCYCLPWCYLSQLLLLLPYIQVGQDEATVMQEIIDERSDAIEDVRGGVCLFVCMVVHHGAAECLVDLQRAGGG